MQGVDLLTLLLVLLHPWDPGSSCEEGSVDEITFPKPPHDCLQAHVQAVLERSPRKCSVKKHPSKKKKTVTIKTKHPSHWRRRNSCVSGELGWPGPVAFVT